MKMMNKCEKPNLRINQSEGKESENGEMFRAFLSERDQNGEAFKPFPPGACILSSWGPLF